MNGIEHQRWLRAWNEGLTFAEVLDAVEFNERDRNVKLLRKRSNEVDELGDAKRRTHDRVAAHALLCVALELGKMADAIAEGGE